MDEDSNSTIVGSEEETDGEENDYFDIDDAEVPLDELSLPLGVRCAAHTANLVSTTDLKKVLQKNATLKKAHEQMMKKCSLLWKTAKFRRSKEIMKKELGIILKRPVITRWNSLHNALAQILELKNEIPNLCRKLDIRKILSEANFTYIKYYVESTKDISTFTTIIQGDIHYGYLLPSLLNLRRKLDLLKSDFSKDAMKSQFLPLVKGQLESLAIRFKDFYDVENQGIAAAVATFFHPLFKSLWLKRFPEAERKKVYEKIKDRAVRESPQTITSAVTVQDTPEENPDSFLYISPDSMEVDLQLDQPDILQEISAYVKDKSKDLTMLNRYPLIRNLFFKFNSVPPSSASVERLFSYATYMSAPRYARLQPKRFEQRVILMSNLKKM